MNSSIFRDTKYEIVHDNEDKEIADAAHQVLHDDIETNETANNEEIILNEDFESNLFSRLTYNDRPIEYSTCDSADNEELSPMNS
jgi:hypothetical protein